MANQGGTQLRKREQYIHSQMTELYKKVERQEEKLKKYQSLASIVQEADVWEYSIYNEIPDDSWVALDRRDYMKILQALSELDELRPWKSTIEKRLGRV